MATANKALKKRAQAFAEKHELSYLQALKAVDEPLHQLRGLTKPEELERLGYYPYFRLIDENERERIDPRSAYAELIAAKFPAVDAQEQIIAEKKLPHFATPEDLFHECAKRLSTVHGAGVADIWSYRELHRAGILDPEAPILEPILHYFGWNLSQDGDFGRFQGSGKLGVFCVSIAEGRFRGTKGLIPVTGAQLGALKSGESMDRIELTLLSEAGSFYRLQESHELQTEKEDKQTADREAVNYFVDLIDNYLEGMDRSERSSLRPVIRDLVSQGSVTMENIVTELRSAQSPTARELGARIVRATGVSVIYSTTGKTAEKGSAVDILNALGLDDDELRSAREEVALERARESMVQSMSSLCLVLISDFGLGFEANNKLIRDFALGELDENGGANFLAGIVRTLRMSDSPDARRIGARLIDGLATLDDADEETSDEVHAIISSMQTTATRIDEMRGTISVVYPY